MKLLSFIFLLVVCLQVIYSTDSTVTDGTTTVSKVSTSLKSCSAFIYKCTAAKKLDDGATPTANPADSISFAWEIKGASPVVTLVKDTDFYQQDITFADVSGVQTAYSYIVIKPSVFTVATADNYTVKCTQTQKYGQTTLTLAAPANLSDSKSAGTIDITACTGTTPTLLITEDNACAVKAFIQSGVPASDKMFVLGQTTQMSDYTLGEATLAAPGSGSVTYTIVAQKASVDANVVTQYTLSSTAANNCSAKVISTSTDTCSLQVLTFEGSIITGLSDQALTVSIKNGSTDLVAADYYQSDAEPSAATKKKYSVVLLPKKISASAKGTFVFNYKQGNVLVQSTKEVTMTTDQTTCDSKPMTSAFANDCSKNTIQASAASKWSYYGLATGLTPPASADKYEIGKKGIYIADQSTTGASATIKQEYYLLTNENCVNIEQTSTATDRCADMTFKCHTNVTPVTYAWSVSPFSAKALSSTLDAQTLTVAKNTFTDESAQTLKCTVGNNEDTQVLSIIKTACTASPAADDDDDDDGSSILSILALLLVALLL